MPSNVVHRPRGASLGGDEVFDGGFEKIGRGYNRNKV